jgi:23S rRNA (adenine2503-C2)-methyltransferase
MFFQNISEHCTSLTTQHASHKPSLKGLTQAELEDYVLSVGEKKYRARQLFQWMYQKQAQSFDEMTDVSRAFRTHLTETAVLENLRLVAEQKSLQDGTTKFLFELSDGRHIETVLIPPPTHSPAVDSRLTLCISTQVGCPLDCQFCATGTMGFSRNLTAGEIIDQVLQIQRRSPRRISNVVYMGMGEPFLNYDNVMKSVGILTSDESINIGTRHITISTAGYADRMKQMADEQWKVKLALSLHSLDEARRIRLMPITKKFGIAALTAALIYYYKKTGLRPTLEYILFDGYNDRVEDVNNLISLSKKIPLKINLIPFHSIAFTGAGGLAAELQPASADRMETFAARLRKANITAMVRTSSGSDINAACGQLAVQERTKT